MATITETCESDLELNAFPCDGEVVDLGHPVMIVLQKLSGSLVQVGENPTVSEVQTGLAASGADKLIVIEEITNGQLIEASRQETSGADTADGLKEVLSINMKVTGKIKRFSTGVLQDLAKLNREKRLRAWIITSTGYWIGGAGFKVSNFFTTPILEGYGVKGYVPVDFEYVVNKKKTFEYAQDDAYLNLVNTNYTT